MLYILSGPDDFSLTQALEKIKKESGDPAALALNTTTLDGHQVTLELLRNACETVPFLADKRLVVIKGLLERFEPRKRPVREKKAAQLANQPEEYQAFASVINGLPASTLLVLIDSAVSKNNPLFVEIAAKAAVKSFPLLRDTRQDTRLSQWIRERVNEEGGSIAPQAVALLSKMVGSNLWTMSSEINKLVLFADGRRIEEADVKSITSDAQQASVFNMVDAIVESRGEPAGQLLHQLLQNGEAPVSLLYMLARQIGLIVRAIELSKQRKPNIEIQTRLGITQEFVLRKTLEQARRYSLPRLKEVYRQLLETDLSIKTGKYDGELALELLVTELCQQGKA